MLVLGLLGGGFLGSSLVAMFHGESSVSWRSVTLPPTRRGP
jgi:hypothetical protein